MMRMMRLTGGGALYALLAVAMTWPLAASLGSLVPSGGDNLYVAWSLAWIAHALATAPGRLFDGNIFYPVRDALAFSDPNVSSALVVAPLHYAGASPAVLVNVLVLASFVLGGLAAGFMVASFGGEARAALAAGVFFAFSPLRFTHLDHAQLYASWWIPLALATFDRYLREGRAVDAWLTAASIAMEAYASVYLVVFELAALALLFVAAVACGRARRPWRSAVVGMVGPAIAVGLVCVPLGWAYLSASRTWAVARSIEENVYYSASPSSWLAAVPSNVVWGGLLSRFADSTAPWEKFLFPGVVPVALAVVGAVRRPRAFEVRFGLLLFAAGVLLSLGPYVAVAGHTIPLPHAVAFAWLPPLRALRTPARWALLASLGLASAAAAGAAALPRRALWPIVVLAIAEAWVRPFPATPVPVGERSLYGFLAEGSGPVIELPLASSTTERYSLEPPRMYRSTLHWRPVANGYSGYTPPPYRELVRMFEADSAADVLRFVAAWDVRTVVVHLDEVAGADREAWESAPAIAGVSEVFRDERTRVFRLTMPAERFAPPNARIASRPVVRPRARQALELGFDVVGSRRAVPIDAIGWRSGRARWTAEEGASKGGENDRWARYFCPPAIPSRLEPRPLFVEPPDAPGRYRLELDAGCFTLSSAVEVVSSP